MALLEEHGIKDSPGHGAWMMANRAIIHAVKESPTFPMPVEEVRRILGTDERDPPPPSPKPFPPPPGAPQ